MKDAAVMRWPEFSKTRRSCRFALAALLIIFVPIGTKALETLESLQPVWLDETTGLAMAGYDPLSYFTGQAPVRGIDETELVWRGAIWRFANHANRLAFKYHPGIYTPRFAGYDAYMVSKGIAVRGRPSIWTIHDNRLYLFASGVNKFLWSGERKTLLATARKNWRRLGRDLMLATREPDRPPVKAKTKITEPDIVPEFWPRADGQ